MEQLPEEFDDCKHTVFEYIIIFANLICLSLESFADNEQKNGTTKSDIHKEIKK